MLMIDSESESFSFSLHFNGHFPGGPGLAGTRMSPFWLLLELVKISASTNQHPELFTGRTADALPVARPTVSKH